MSFFRRLLGRLSPAERLADAERLLAAGDPGLARLELEAVHAAADIDEGLRARAFELLVRAREALVRARLEEAENLIEADAIEEAHRALEVARGLSPGRELLAELRALEKRADAASDEALEVAGPQPLTAPPEPEPLTAASPEGSEELSPLEEALLPFDLDEAERLHELCAEEPALGEALVLRLEGNVGAAIERFAALTPVVARSPLVARERARTLHVSGDEAAARELLEGVLGRGGAADAGTVDLALEVLAALGDTAAAAPLARDAFARDLPIGLERALVPLVDEGYVDEALSYLDRVVERRPSDVAGWHLRGNLCARADRAEAAAAADGKALALYAQQCKGCGGGQVVFPVGSGRRRAEALLAREDDLRRAERDEVAGLIHSLIDADPEAAGRWQRELAALGRT